VLVCERAKLGQTCGLNWITASAQLSSGIRTIVLRFRTGPGIQSQKFLNGSGADAVKPNGRLVEKLRDTDALRLKRRFGD